MIRIFGFLWLHHLPSLVDATMESDVAVEWLTLLLRIRDVSGSVIGPETGYPD
jgi:hypothetical protein